MDKADEKQVKAVVHRCPFCHEGAEAEGSVACQGCLARHHEACWSEAGRCGSCGSERALAPAPRPSLTIDQASSALQARGYTAGEVEAFFATLRPPAARLGRGSTFALLGALVAAVLLAVLAAAAYRSKAADARRSLDVLHARELELKEEQRAAFVRQERHRASQRLFNALLSQARELEGAHTEAVNELRAAEERRRATQGHPDPDITRFHQEQVWAAEKRVKDLARERSLVEQELEQATLEQH